MERFESFAEPDPLVDNTQPSGAVEEHLKLVNWRQVISCYCWKNLGGILPLSKYSQTTLLAVDDKFIISFLHHQFSFCCRMKFHLTAAAPMTRAFAGKIGRSRRPETVYHKINREVKPILSSSSRDFIIVIDNPYNGPQQKANLSYTAVRTALAT
ncbi:MAG: hypothetical protein R3293_16205 [Candidatus Promineifilaceae bacterium]|nr:hypothetical protein [Candidatus Promineifilaceae bacterium]